MDKYILFKKKETASLLCRCEFFSENGSISEKNVSSTSTSLARKLEWLLTF